MAANDTDNQSILSWWGSVKEHFPWKEFGFGAIVPIIIYYILHTIHQPLLGALLAASWGVGMLLITHFILGRVNIFAILAIPLTLIEIVGILVTQSPDFYLATSAIDHFLWGVAFMMSVFVGRPLILILAEAMGCIPQSAEMERFRNTREFQAAWVSLTTIWAGAHFLSAVILVVFQLWMPIELFLIIRILLNLPLLAVLIALSFWYPEWYWDLSKD